MDLAISRKHLCGGIVGIQYRIADPRLLDAANIGDHISDLTGVERGALVAPEL